MKRGLVFTLVLALGALGLAVAQEEKPRRERGERPEGQPKQGSAKTGLESHLAACLILGNKEEIAISQFLEGRTENEQVQQFAKMMVEEHTKAIAELEKFAPQGTTFDLKVESRAFRPGQDATKEKPAATDKPAPTTEKPADKATRDSTGDADDRLAAADRDARKQARGDKHDVAHQLLDIQRAAAENCLSMTLGEFEEKQGKELDMCYLGQQIGAHIGMLAKLQAIETAATGEFQQLVQQQQQSVQAHLDHAKKLIKETEGAAGRTE